MNFRIDSRQVCRAGLTLITALVSLALAAPAHAAFPGTNGKIAYESGGDIRTVDPDGTGGTNLTNGAANESQPSWSADGKKIAFVTDANLTRPCGNGHPGPTCNYEVYVMNADGSGPNRVTTTTQSWETGPRFSPDGTRLAYTRFVQCIGDESICFLYVDVSDLSGQPLPFTTGLGRTPNGGFAEYDPAWSPDGTKIAFVHDDEDFMQQIYVSNVDGSDARLVGPGDVFDWSPDQSKLLVGAPPGRLATQNVDGTALTYVTDPPTGSADFFGVWSPDGKKIAFFRYTDMRYPTPPKREIYVANADGSSPVKIADGASPSWQPLPGPQRSDFKNAAQFCKAERAFLGDSAFGKKYGSNGNGANAYGKCVSGN